MCRGAEHTSLTPVKKKNNNNKTTTENATIVKTLKFYEESNLYGIKTNILRAPINVIQQHVSRRLWLPLTEPRAKNRTKKSQATRRDNTGVFPSKVDGSLPGGVEAMPSWSVQDLSPALGTHDAILKVIAAAKVSWRIPVQGHRAGGGGVHDQAPGCGRRP